MADMDDDNYDTKVENRKSDGRAPYHVTYQNMEDAETIEELSRQNWLSKNSYQAEQGIDGLIIPIGMNMIGLASVVNTVYYVVGFFQFTKNSTDNSAHYTAWLSLTGINFLMWSPIFLLWPLAFIGSQTTLGWYVNLSRVARVIGWYLTDPLGLLVLVFVSFLLDDNGNDPESMEWLQVLSYIFVTGGTFAI